MNVDIDYHFACSKCGQEHMDNYKFKVNSFPGEEVEEILEPNKCIRCMSEIDILFRYDPQTLCTDYFIENSIKASDPYFYYTKAFVNSIYSLEELEEDKTPNSDLIKRLFFSHSITIMEAYLSDLFKFYINNNFDCFIKFIESSNQLKDQKFTLTQYLKKPSIALEKVSERLDSILFHNIGIVDSLFSGIFGDTLNKIIGSKDRETIERIIEYRHHMVHRNGRTNDGQTLEITDEVKLRVFSIIKNFITQIHQYVTSKDIMPDRNISYLWRYMDHFNTN